MAIKTNITSASSSLIEEALVDSVQLTRYAIKGGKADKNDPVLTTHGLVAFIDKGVSTWKLDLSHHQTVTPAQMKTPYAAIIAEWLDTQQALERGIQVVHGVSANSFGGMGALLVPDDFRIPAVLADRDNVKHYGLRLLDNQSEFAISSRRYEIALMRYTYNKRYRADFLIQSHGGGGIFVETHDFPHVHIPLSEDCGGYIVIGKKTAEHEYHFTAFQIPYGHALYTPSNTIHGDGTLVGEYAITVADSAYCPANTVLMYSEKTLAMAREIVPQWND